MIRNKSETAMYKIIPDSMGNRYQFFCDLSGADVCITRPVKMDDPQEELMVAWKTEGRQYFNQCHRCGKWVIDVMYNADVGECVQCTPWEEQSPRYCKHCGAEVQPGKAVCMVCQKSLTY